MELSFPRTFAPGKQKWRGTFMELSFPQST